MQVSRERRPFLRPDFNGGGRAEKDTGFCMRTLQGPTRRKRVLLLLQYYDYRHHAGVARYAAKAGWALEDAYTMVRGLPETWDGDGIVSFHGASQEFVTWLGTARVPVVDIGEYEEYSDFPRVTTDADRI